MASEKGIIKHIKESVESLYNHCNKFEHVHNMFSNLLVTHEKQERDRIEKEFNEKEEELSETLSRRIKEFKKKYDHDINHEKRELDRVKKESDEKEKRLQDALLLKREDLRNKYRLLH